MSPFIKGQQIFSKTNLSHLFHPELILSIEGITVHNLLLRRHVCRTWNRTNKTNYNFCGQQDGTLSLKMAEYIESILWTTTTTKRNQNLLSVLYALQFVWHIWSDTVYLWIWDALKLLTHHLPLHPLPTQISCKLPLADGDVWHCPFLAYKCHPMWKCKSLLFACFTGFVIVLSGCMHHKNWQRGSQSTLWHG
jgi:hypothetical protein